jgi:hypothetical protein
MARFLTMVVSLKDVEVIVLYEINRVYSGGKRLFDCRYVSHVKYNRMGMCMVGMGMGY